MFGKVHQSFFDSSINDTDPVTRLIFIGMIVLSDKEGRLDVTSQSLARRLNVDHDSVVRAIGILMSPDQLSRSAAEDGRRIVPIDPARSWGWVVVNKMQYRAGEADRDVIRAQTRERVRRHRSKEKNQKKNDPDTDTDTDTGVTVSNADVTEKTLHAWFEAAWDAYPKKDGRREAWKHYRASVASADDRDRLLTHLANYKAQLASAKTEFRFIKAGSTWFNNWSDEVYAIAPAPIVHKEKNEAIGKFFAGRN